MNKEIKCVLFDREDVQWNATKGAMLVSIGSDKRNDVTVKEIVHIEDDQYRILTLGNKQGKWGRPFDVTVNPNDVGY